MDDLRNTPSEAVSRMQMALAMAYEFKMPELAKKLAKGVDPTKPFDRYNLNIMMRRAVAYEECMKEHNGSPVGIEFRNKDRSSWAFIVEDATEAGKFRVQYFDEQHFSRHATRPSLEECVEMMVTEGYREKDVGALERLSSTTKWALGGAYSDLIHKHNAGLMPWGQLHDELQKLNEAYGVACA